MDLRDSCKHASEYGYIAGCPVLSSVCWIAQSFRFSERGCQEFIGNINAAMYQLDPKGCRFIVRSTEESLTCNAAVFLSTVV